MKPPSILNAWNMSAPARVIQVIEVQTTIGDGTDEDPVRIVTAYRSLDGAMLAVNDPYARRQQFPGHSDAP